MTVRETHCVMHWMQLIYPVNIIHHKNNCGLDLSLASAFFDPKTKENAPLCCFSPSHIDLGRFPFTKKTRKFRW